MPKATSVAISSSTVESQSSTTLEGGRNASMKFASLPGKGVATTNSISNYRTDKKIPPIGKLEYVADKQQEATSTLPIANMAAKESVSSDKQSQIIPALTGGTRAGSTIVLISTKISNPSTTAKMGSGTAGAMIKTTGTLYNIPSTSPADHSDTRRLSAICQETAKVTGEEINGQSETQSTSKTATILVSKHKTKTGLPLLLKKSKK